MSDQTLIGKPNIKKYLEKRINIIIHYTNSLLRKCFSVVGGSEDVRGGLTFVTKKWLFFLKASLTAKLSSSVTEIIFYNLSQHTPRCEEKRKLRTRKGFAFRLNRKGAKLDAADRGGYCIFAKPLRES